MSLIQICQYEEKQSPILPITLFLLYLVVELLKTRTTAKKQKHTAKI